MEYYLYLNWTHDYVGIHKSDCNMCKGGKGMQVNSSKQNGIWIGPFMDEVEATFVAKKLRRAKVVKCTRCL